MSPCTGGSCSLSRLKVSDRDLGHMASLKFNFSRTNELMVHSHASKYGCCCKEGAILKGGCFTHTFPPSSRKKICTLTKISAAKLRSK